MAKKFFAKISRIFTTDSKVKAVCLVLAAILWLFVSSNQSLIGKFPTSISIKTVNLSNDYAAFFDQDNVQITAMAEPSIWRTLTADSFVASVDVAGLKEGTYDLEVKVVSQVSDVQITKIEPSRVFVTIDKIIEKDLDIEVKIDGDPADEMIVGQVNLSTEQVKARGPSSLVNSISEAGVVLKLNGENNSFEREVKVVALSENSSELKGVTFDPSNINLSVSIVKGGNNKTVGIRVKTKGSPKDGYYVSKITTTPNVIDIVGQRSSLSEINYIETEEIDISNQAASLTRDAKLVFPSGVSLQKGSSSSVKVQIDFTETGSSRLVTPSIVPLNLSSGLKLSSVSPTDFKVNVSGSSSALNLLNSSNVVLEIDLSQKAAGTYQIDLDTSMVRLPGGVVATGFIPATLSIVLSY